MLLIATPVNTLPPMGDVLGPNACATWYTKVRGVSPPNPSLAELTGREDRDVTETYILIWKTMYKYIHHNLNKMVIVMKTLNYTVPSAK